jgi:hypothetical protein
VFGMRELLPPDTRYVTVLQEPVARTLSHYLPEVTLEEMSLRPAILARQPPDQDDCQLAISF